MYQLPIKAMSLEAAAFVLCGLLVGAIDDWRAIVIAQTRFVACEDAGDAIEEWVAPSALAPGFSETRRLPSRTEIGRCRGAAYQSAHWRCSRWITTSLLSLISRHQARSAPGRSIMPIASSRSPRTKWKGTCTSRPGPRQVRDAAVLGRRGRSVVMRPVPAATRRNLLDALADAQQG
jgi:hypothetical protein